MRSTLPADVLDCRDQEKEHDHGEERVAGDQQHDDEGDLSAPCVEAAHEPALPHWRSVTPGRRGMVASRTSTERVFAADLALRSGEGVEPSNRRAAPAPGF